jgi:hypothetical protein
MKLSPFHSTEQDEEAITPVYHDNAACKEGKLVDKNYRRYGTDNRPLCKRCGTLNNAGK